MSDSSRERKMARLAELRQTMTDDDLVSLKARFSSDPKSLSIVEVEFLWLATQERIFEYEDEARRLGLIH
jgi:hypothetical protein